METTRTSPSGTVTFLFTDIEGSTRLWEQHANAMRLALARHDAILQAAIEMNGGHVFKTMGDQFCAAFPTASEALAAALDAQRALQAEVWSDIAELCVRMAVHTGAAEERGGDYFGPPLNRVARLLDAGRGGQILLSQATAELVRDALPDAAALHDLGTHRLKDLQQPEHPFQVMHPDLPRDFPPLRSLEEFAHNLPRQLTSFIGRERELAEVIHLLSTTCLLTLIGAGGTGKTRLALQVAADLLEEYPDGVWLVELAPLADPDLVPQTVASVLAVREEPERPLTQTLADYLRPKQGLLVLDNCEHLLAACAELADALLRSCPKLRILASSREGLGIAGERTYRVPSLSLPPPGHLPPVERLTEYEAVRLFVERAMFTQSSFAVTVQNAPAVAQVCQRLDGIPLAIELAAARVKALPVEKIAERLDDRFRLLTGGSRTALPRQQTLQALIDWSYDLLSEPEQLLLRRLSVFAGGWTLEAAEAVCSGEGIEAWEVLDLLTNLVDRSLVNYEEEGSQERYRLLETVRQYSRDRLLEAGEAAVHGRHCDFFVQLAEQAEPKLLGPEQVAWYRRLEVEHDNLRAALEWALKQQPVSALRLAGAQQEFWDVRGYWSEGLEALERGLGRGVEGPGEVRTKALRAAWSLATRLGEWENDPTRILRARELKEMLVREQGDDAPAVSTYYLDQMDATLIESRLASSRAIGDKQDIALCLETLGWQVFFRTEYDRAAHLAEEYLAVSQEVGNMRFIALAHDLRWNIAVRQGEYGRAVMHLDVELALSREIGDKGGISWSLVNLARLALHHGDSQRAALLSEESLALFRELRAKRGISWSLYVVGIVAWNQEQYERAAALWEEGLALFRELGHKDGIANALSALGMVARREREEDRAAGLFTESLAAFRETATERGIVPICAIEGNIEARWAIAECLEGLAAGSLRAQPGGRATAPGVCERAVRLGGAAEALRDASSAPLLPAECADAHRSAAALRTALGDAAFAAAWAEGRAMSLHEAIEYALVESGTDTPT